VLVSYSLQIILKSILSIEFCHDRLNRPLKSKETGEERTRVSFEGRPEHGNETSVCNVILTNSIYSIYSTVLFMGAVASWLARWNPDRADWVRVLARDIVLCSCTEHFCSHSASHHPNVKKGMGKVILWGKPYDGLASNPKGNKNTLGRFKPWKQDMGAGLTCH